MLNKNQDQSVKDDAIAVQVGGNFNITQVGLSYSDVRDVALDVFRSNFYQLAGQAKEIAKVRAEEITEDFLKKLQAEHPAGFNKGQDPDFQYALFTVQKEYARNGDKDLGDLLVDLLVDRSKQDQRDILQIVLNESLKTAPKLTDNQLAALTLIFILRYTSVSEIGNHDDLGLYFDKHVAPFASKIVKNDSCYQHLEFTGCGSVQTVLTGQNNLESWLELYYEGLFLKGFDKQEIADRGITIGHDPLFFTTCLNDSTKVQVRANKLKDLEKHLDTNHVTTEDKTKILKLFAHNKMSHAEIRHKCISIRPYMSDIFDTWSNSRMKSFTLTSVGIAIGHANLKRLIGEFANLAIWID